MTSEYGDGVRDAQIEVRDALKDLEGAREMTIMGYDVEALTADDVETLLAVATLYVQAFPQMIQTLPEKLWLKQIEDILERHGRLPKDERR